VLLAMRDIQSRPTACNPIMSATTRDPVPLVRKPTIRSGFARHMRNPNKYDSAMIAATERFASTVCVRIRRDSSTRSRIVRPTVANVVARLPPTSQCAVSDMFNFNTRRDARPARVGHVLGIGGKPVGCVHSGAVADVATSRSPTRSATSNDRGAPRKNIGVPVIAAA
jgi:hypothetical protein